ncbi:MAG: NAD-dependent epimerase/dehydratase family protein [Phycisphaerae bacterium]
MLLSPSISDESQLEDLLSEPTESTCRLINGLDGDIAVLGAAGKMGPGLCRMLKIAAPKKTVFAVSRFSDLQVMESLNRSGIKTLSADLADPLQYPSIPKVPNVYYLVGMKFGASRSEPLTWAMNVYVPALVCEHFKQSKIVALSTGNVYPFTEPGRGGADEDTQPDPRGEYAQSCLGRERIFQYFSQKDKLPVVLIRLNYANEPRYGIIVDVTKRILAGEPIDLTMGHVNLIWQGDANDYIARAISQTQSPAGLINLAGPETVSVRYLAGCIGQMVNREPIFTGSEDSTALLSNASRCFDLFGYPTVSLFPMVRAIVNWVASGKPVFNKPTKFQVRNGRF